MNKKNMVINMVKRNGFISYEAACNMVDWDLHNLHSAFRASALEKAGLTKVVLDGVKGYTFMNKSLAIRTLVNQRKAVGADKLKELTGWDAHVLGSALRASKLEQMGWTKENGEYKVA